MVRARGVTAALSPAPRTLLVALLALLLGLPGLLPSVGAHALVPSSAPSGAPSRASTVAPAMAPAPVGPAPPSPAVGPRPSVADNSSPIPEAGTIVAQVSVGTDPKGVAYDPSDGYLYVANLGGGSVSVINRSTVLKTVTVGSDPFGVAYDPGNGDVYVTNSLSGSVSVLNGTRVVGTITLSGTPTGIAVDTESDEVYVAVSDSNNVSIIDGQTVIANISVPSGPTGVAYDPTNGYIYVTDTSADNVSVISGNRQIATVPVAGSPSQVAYDPADQQMYVTDQNAANVTRILDTAAVNTFAVPSGPEGLVFDPANSLLYVACAGMSELIAVNISKIASTRSIAAMPFALAYDPTDGAVAITASSANEVLLLSTLFAESPAVATDQGRPVTTTDVNQSLTLSATIWAPGAGNLHATSKVLPSPGLGCAGSPTLLSANLVETITLDCSPTRTGTYTVWLNATDAASAATYAFLYLVVDPALAIPLPRTSAVSLGGFLTIDTNETVHFSIAPTGGSGYYTGYLWQGVDPSNCTSLTAAALACTFPSPRSLDLDVEVTDSNEATSASPTLSVAVTSAPMARAPTANRSAADVGQSVLFRESGLGGGGGIVRTSWAGFPAADCATQPPGNLACSWVSPGSYNITATVTDALGVSSTSPPLEFPVVPLPSIGLPYADRTSVDSGQTVRFFVNASGGSGGLSYSWTGLPGACTGATTSTPVCRAGAAATYLVGATVIDSNGGSVPSSGTIDLSVSADPVAQPVDLSTASVTTGGSVELTENVTGGTAPFTYRWNGLPQGCASEAAAFTCQPSATGTFRIYVVVTDGSNLSTSSPNVTLTVGSSGGLASDGTLLALAGVVGAAVVLALAVLLLRRRRAAARGDDTSVEPGDGSTYDEGPVEDVEPPEEPSPSPGEESTDLDPGPDES